MHKAIFFDRDGVINHDLGYIHKIEDFNFIEKSKEAIKLCCDKGYKIFVVTNQSGVARGLYKEEDIHILHNYIQEELNKIDAHIDEFAYCPHHIGGIIKEYAIECDCRKPKAGMITRLIDKHNIDLANSFIIGDNERDVEAGNNAGIDGYLFKEANLLEFIEKIFKERNI